MKHRYVTYLDLMCCGFGGALLMFLIVASARAYRQESKPMLVVRAQGISDDGSPLQTVELGLQYRRRGETNWTRANATLNHDSICMADGEAWFFNSTAASGNGSEAVFICNRPRSGQWEVRAYSVFTASEAMLGRPAASQPPPLEVQLEVLGADQRVFKKALIDRSAQFSESLAFEVSGKSG